MIEQIELIDRKILLFINGLHADWLDPIMKAISSSWFWLPIIVLFIFFAIKIYKKKSIIPIIAVCLCFSFTDITSHSIKESVKRYRPTHNLEIKDQIHTVNDYWGGQYGFFSGHASNSFGLAFLSLLFIRKKYYSIIVITWAVIVSYSRMYLGVHYPADIFVGTIWGIASAIIFYFATKRISKKILIIK